MVIIESDAVFLLPQVSGREELEKKSAIHPAQRMAINMPTRYGVYFNYYRNLQTTIVVCKSTQGPVLIFVRVEGLP